MKVLNFMLVLSAPTILAAGYLPDNSNYQYINEKQIVYSIFDYDNFRLSKQPYYTELFTKKELKKLAKAEKYREQAAEALVLSAAIQKQADELRLSSPELSSNIQKQIAKLEAKSADQELKGLKLYEKAADVYRVVYTNVLNNKTFSASTISEKTAQNLALESQVDYENADNIKEKVTSENTLETYRGVYANLNKAVQNQEVALAIFHGDKNVDYTKYIDNTDTTKVGNIAKEEIPTLIAKEHYNFEKDTNVYRFRFHQFENKLNVSDDDRKIVLKLEGDEANSVTHFQKAESFGFSADTLRVYSGESTTLAEREYYEQKAQENELNECSNLLKAVKLEVNSNNTLFTLYKKYIPKVRDNNNTIGKNFEEQANSLFELSKTYTTLAAKQHSLVEQYTQLSEGNEVKLQAIENMENAIAAYLGDTTVVEKTSLATGASEKHNDIVMDFGMDESDGADTQAAKQPSNKQSNVNATAVADNKNTVKPVADKDTSATKNNVAKNNNTSNKPATNNNNSNNKTTRKPLLAQSTAPIVSTSYYTKSDQRLKPYTYPKGTIFSVEAGIYKEMPEPVEFPSIEKFLAQNLKNQTYMRYYIGEFETFDAAYAACAMAKEEGYQSALVVAFVNGKNSDVNAAKKNAEKTANYKDKVQKELKALNYTAKATTPVQTDTKKTGAAVPLSELTGELYAVQISSVPTMLNMEAFNVSELYYDRNDAGLYRYYTGISNDSNIANTNLATMRQSGYDDAYLIRVVDGKNFGAVSSTKTNSIPVYRVQIGAFKAALASNNKAQIDNLKAQGYAIHTSKSGEYTVYTVGDYGSREQAEKLRKDLLNKGFAGCYVVVFVNGVKQ